MAKRKLSIFTTILMVFCLTGCSLSDFFVTHKHTFASEWTYDDQYHWHAATCEHTEEIDGKEYHSFVTEVIKEATYSEGGLEELTCRTCGFKKTQETKPIHCDHPSELLKTRIETIKEPTCYDTGRERQTVFCMVCGKDIRTYYFDLEALGHEYVNHEAKSPTCDEIGWTEYITCSRCDYTTYKELPALGHDLVHHDEQEPTCEEIGWEEYDTCSRCGYSTYEEEPKLGHDLVHHEAKEATCTEIGWIAYDTCTRCDYTTYKEIEATGHLNLKTRVENQVNPTCTSKGSYDLVTYCEDDEAIISTENKVIEELGHDLIHHDAQDPTCTEIGWKEYYTCSRCDYTTYEEIAALGHDLIHHDAQDPTCTKVGWKEYDSCSRCDYTTYEEIPALGHDLVHHDAKAATCTEIGWKAYDTCSRCNHSTYQKINAKGHSYGQWTVTKPATQEEDGIRERVCSVCGYKDYEAIEKQHLEFILDTDSDTYMVSGIGTWTDAKLVIPETYEGKSVTSIKSQAFKNCRFITEIFVPNTIQSIGLGAFSGCNVLEKITLPIIGAKNYSPSDTNQYGLGYIFGTAYFDYGIKTSQQYYSSEGTYRTQTFYIPSSLKEVVITSLTRIPYGAFYGCSNITTVTFSDTITEIGAYAFYHCDGFETLNISGNITSIGEYAYARCNSLETLNIGNNVTTIGNYAFYDCNSLINVNIGNNVTTIGNGAFSYCNSLKSITIPACVTTIQDFAFMGCNNLFTVIAYCEASTFEEKAFLNCYKYIELYSLSVTNPIVQEYDANGNIIYPVVHNSLSDPSIIKTEGDFVYYTLEGTNYLLSYLGSDAELILPNKLGGGNYNICTTSFSGSTFITSITFGEGVKQVYDDSFDGCVNVTHIKILGNTSFYNYGDFVSCTTLKTAGPIGSNCDIEFAWTESIPDYGLQYFKHLESITIPDTIKTIGKYAFASCTSLKSITIPDSVTKIGIYCLSGCSELETITIPFVGESIPKSDSDAQKPLGFIFNYGYVSSGTKQGNDYYSIPSSLKEVIVTGNTKIPNYAFQNCTNLTKIVIQGDAKTLGSYSFDNCSNLTDLTLNDSITTIQSYAFNNCAGLESIVIPSSTTTIANNVFNSCSNLTSVSFNNVITTIGAGAFAYCTSLKEIAVPNTVTSIGKGAFAACIALEKITLPFVGGDQVDSNHNPVSNYRFGYIFGTTSYLDLTLKCEINGSDSGDKTVYYIPKSLTEVVITGTNEKDSYCYLPIFAFDSVSTLVNIEFTCKEVYVSKYSFGGCTSLTKVIIDKFSNGIPDAAFTQCTSLVKVLTFDVGNKIGQYAFYNCKELKTLGYGDVTITSDVKSIGQYAFYQCAKIESVKTYDMPITFGEYCFAKCTSLKTVYLSKLTDEIGNYAFMDCTSLQKFIFNASTDYFYTISRGYRWNYNAGGYYVVCTDGNLPKSKT